MKIALISTAVSHGEEEEVTKMQSFALRLDMTEPRYKDLINQHPLILVIGHQQFGGVPSFFWLRGLFTVKKGTPSPKQLSSTPLPGPTIG